MDSVLFVLAVAFTAGLFGAETAERLRQPAVVGEIVAGVIVGPAVLGWIPAGSDRPPAASALEAVAELGVILLLFTVGLEMRLGDLQVVGRRAFTVAAGGVVLPFVSGWGLMRLLGENNLTALFVGTALVATSVGVTARVLRDRGMLQSDEARIIVAAAVIDDVLALMLLGLVSGLAEGDQSVAETALVIGLALAFLATILTVGRATLRRALPFLARLRATDPVLGLAIAILLWLAVSADFLGLAPIVGAFVAGILFAEIGDRQNLESKMRPLVVFLTPMFFVYVGTLLDTGIIASMESLLLVAIVTVLALAAKFVGAGAAGLSLGGRSAAIIGVGMGPRGEVGIVVAALGLKLGVVDNQIYGVVVLVSLLTTLIAPPLLGALSRRPPS